MSSDNSRSDKPASRESGDDQKGRESGYACQVEVPGSPYGARLFWTESGIFRVVITTRGRNKPAPGAKMEPPRFVSRAASAISAFLEGGPDPWSVQVDLSGLTPFQSRVLEATRLIPRGKVATYGWVAMAAGANGAARAVGRALATNSLPLIYPCHRVIASDLALHGFTSSGGLKTKGYLLDLEAVPFTARGVVAFGSVLR